MSLPLLDNAFLPEYQDVFDIIEISVAGIALIIQLCIGALAYWKLRRSESRISVELVSLFFIAGSCALLYTGVSIVSVALHLVYGLKPVVKVGYAICSALYVFFDLILLLTFVARLYYVFKQSALRMSKQTVYLYVVLFVVLFILFILGIVGFTLRMFGNEQIGWPLTLFAMISGLSVYAVSCAVAVRLFVINLSTAAKMQISSQRNVSVQPKDFSLNDKQQTLLHLSAKYVLLFVVAILSSISCFFFIVILSREFGSLFVSIDLCVNLWCLYLQFAFAANEYQRCCVFLDSRCRSLEVNRMKRIIHKDSLSVKSESPTHSV